MGAGKQLRQAREALGLTVRDIAERTKIPSRQIDAIETEHYEKLPGGIFGRGYVRAVAAALKLDADAIVEAYRDETEAERTAIPAASSVPQQQPAELERAVTPAPWREDRSVLRIRFAPPEVRPERAIAGLVAALLLGLGAVVLILWLGRDRGSAPASSQPVARAPAVSVPPGQRDQAVGTAGAAAELRRRARPAEGGAALRLQADRACWLSLTVDGRTDRAPHDAAG